jgi:xylulokinase
LLAKKRLALGLDLSTQSISSVLLDIDSREIISRHSIDYQRDTRLKKYGISGKDYILPPKSVGEANQPVEMFLAALEAMFADMKQSGLPLRDIITCNVSAQQHGHAYMSRNARAAFSRLNIPGNANSNLNLILRSSFAMSAVPIWLTSNTTEQADAIRNFIGGKERMIQLSGSNSPIRFTGAIIRKIAIQFPDVYRETEYIHLLSSLIPSILTGNSRTAIDFGNACGMSMMDYSSKDWSVRLIKAVSDGLPGGESTLRNKLLPIISPQTTVGRIATYFIEKYGFSPDCRIIAGSGDNPQSKVQVSGNLLSLGTSLVNMVAIDSKNLDMSGYANAMYDGIGRSFAFLCRTNGALVWDRLRAEYGMKKEEYAPAEKALRETPLGKYIVFWQPSDESLPISGSYDLMRVTHDTPALGADYSGLIESTLATVYDYSKKFIKESSEPLYVIGGASKSAEIMRRVAAIWKKPVVPLENVSAASGAAIAGAYVFLKSTGKEVKIEDLSKSILKNSPQTNPDEKDISAYHTADGYLQKLAAKREDITRAHPLIMK